jgi:hypothetical protein
MYVSRYNVCYRHSHHHTKYRKIDQQNKKKPTRGFGGDKERVEALEKMNPEADKYRVLVPAMLSLCGMKYPVPG